MILHTTKFHRPWTTDRSASCQLFESCQESQQNKCLVFVFSVFYRRDASLSQFNSLAFVLQIWIIFSSQNGEHELDELIWLGCLKEQRWPLDSTKKPVNQKSTGTNLNQNTRLGCSARNTHHNHKLFQVFLL